MDKQLAANLAKWGAVVEWSMGGSDAQVLAEYVWDEADNLAADQTPNQGDVGAHQILQHLASNPAIDPPQVRCQVRESAIKPGTYYVNVLIQADFEIKTS